MGAAPGRENCDETVTTPLVPFLETTLVHRKKRADALMTGSFVNRCLFRGQFLSGAILVGLYLAGSGKSTLSFCSAVNTVQLLLLGHAMMTPLLTVAAARSHARS